VKAFDLGLTVFGLAAERASNPVLMASSLVARPHASSVLGLPSRRWFCNRAPIGKTLAAPLLA
jgi:hypothetical protein